MSEDFDTIADNAKNNTNEFEIICSPKVLNPMTIDEHKSPIKASILKSDNENVYNTWFDQVYGG